MSVKNAIFIQFTFQFINFLYNAVHSWTIYRCLLTFNMTKSSKSVPHILVSVKRKVTKYERIPVKCVFSFTIKNKFTYILCVSNQK